MRINSDVDSAYEDFEPVDANTLQSNAAARAQQAALDQAGVTDNSGFANQAAAPVAIPEAAPAPAADPATPTVRASQLANGTATLATAADAAAAPTSILYPTPAATGDLAAILAGPDGAVPLTRDQIVQTVATAVPEAAAVLSSGVTDASLATAFSAVLDAHASPGTKDLHIDLVPTQTSEENVSFGRFSRNQSTTTAASEATSFDASVTVGADGSVNGKKLAADVAEADDAKPYPDSDPTDHTKAEYDVVGDPGNLDNLMAAHGDQPALPRQAIVDTIVAAVPAAKDLIAAGVTDDSLARAFSQVITARGTPGKASLSLDLVPLITTTTTTGYGEYQQQVTTTVPAKTPTTIKGDITVGKDGTVNGAFLPADIATKITSASAGVNQEFKDQTLREVGLSEEWMQNATQDQKDYALAQIVNAEQTDGDKTLDLSYGYTATANAGENSYPVHTVAAGSITLKCKGGKVNGKKLTVDVAYNATKVVNAMPKAVRRATLKSFGFSDAAIAAATPEQQKYVLEKASVATNSPGTTQQFQTQFGNDKYAVGLKIDDKGSIAGVGVQVVPPPPHKSWWKTVVSVVCTVVSFVFPVVAPICMAVNAAIAISNGAHGLGLIAAVAGAAAGIADISGFAAAAETLSSAATTIGTVNGAIQAFQHGDYLGALAGAVSAGSGLAGGLDLDLGDLGSTLQTVGTVAKAADGVMGAIKTGDPLAMLSAGAGAAGALGSAFGVDVPSELGTIGKVASTVDALQHNNVAGAINGLSSLTNNFGLPSANSDGVGGTTRTNNAVVGPPDETDLGDELLGGNVDDDIGGLNAVADGTNAILGGGDPVAGLDAVAKLADTTPLDPDAPVGSQADVREVDNAIDAAGPQLSVRDRFNQAFHSAQATGQRTFFFDPGTGSKEYTTGTIEQIAAAIPGGSLSDYRQFVQNNYKGVDSNAALTAYAVSKAPPPPPVVEQPSIPSVPFNDTSGAQDGSFSAGTRSAPRITSSTDPVEDDNSYFGAVADRLRTIGSNIKTAVTTTTAAGVADTLKGAYNGAVDAPGRGIEYLATTTPEQRRADTAAALGKAYDAVVADPVGAVVGAVNTVVPVKSLYDNVEKLGDGELSAADARRAFYGAVGDTVGVVAAGAIGGAAAKAGRAAAEVADAAVDAGAGGGRAAVVDASTGGGRAAVVDTGAGVGEAGVGEGVGTAAVVGEGTEAGVEAGTKAATQPPRAPATETPSTQTPSTQTPNAQTPSGQPPKVSAPPLETESVLSNEFRGSQYFDMTAKDATGKEVGKVAYVIDTKAGTLEVTGLDVLPEMQGQGVSGQLFKKVLEENPGINAIKASTLQDTNMEVYARVFKETGDMEAAIKATPAYKIRAAAGFTDLEIIDPMATGNPGFIMRRPAAAAVESGADAAATAGADAVAQPAARSADQLARADAALARTEPPLGHYPPNPLDVNGMNGVETLSDAHRTGYQAISDYMFDPAQPIARTQELEALVQKRVAQTGVSTAEALETELSAMEAKAGFKPAIDLEPRAYTDSEWAKMLADGAPFRDTNFIDSQYHGVQTHRVQWWGVARDMELNPAKYGGATAADLYKGIGTANVGSGQVSMWGRLFDTGYDYSPSFGGFYLKHKDLFPGLAGGL